MIFRVFIIKIVDWSILFRKTSRKYKQRQDEDSSRFGKRGSNCHCGNYLLPENHIFELNFGILHSTIKNEKLTFGEFRSLTNSKTQVLNEQLHLRQSP